MAPELDFWGAGSAGAAGWSAFSGGGASAVAAAGAASAGGCSAGGGGGWSPAVCSVTVSVAGLAGCSVTVVGAEEEAAAGSALSAVSSSRTWLHSLALFPAFFMAFINRSGSTHPTTVTFCWGKSM